MTNILTCYQFLLICLISNDKWSFLEVDILCCIYIFLHHRSPAAPTASDCFCTECSLSASGRLPGDFQWSAQCVVAALWDWDHAGSATPAAAEAWSVAAKHCPQGGVHTSAADTRHQYWVRAPSQSILLICSNMNKSLLQMGLSVGL